MELLKTQLANRGTAFLSYFEKPINPKTDYRYAMPKIPKGDGDVHLASAREWWDYNTSIIGVNSTKVARVGKEYVVTILISEQDMDAITNEDWQLDLVASNSLDLYADENDQNEDLAYEDWFMGRHTNKETK